MGNAPDGYPDGGYAYVAKLETKIRLLQEVCEATLLFYRPGPWTADMEDQWFALVHSTEVTTKRLCDAIRAALEEVRRG